VCVCCETGRLDSLSLEEHYHIKMLKLKVTVGSDGSLKVSGAFGDGYAMVMLKLYGEQRWMQKRLSKRQEIYVVPEVGPEPATF
jgi:hypothetical protein